jgi:hypothetical protein
MVMLSEPCLWILCIYRVSIKSSPDYKHLLQENYMEYKYISYESGVEVICTFCTAELKHLMLSKCENGSDVFT